MADDLRTKLGIVRGGLPAEPPRADVVLIFDECDDGRVVVHVAQVAVDPANLDGAKEDRELDVLASFWMRTEYFVSTFGIVAEDIARRRA